MVTTLRRSTAPSPVTKARLLPSPVTAHVRPMFTVTEVEAAAIRAAFEQGGEFSAAVELRRIFPAVTHNGMAREYARTIAGWPPVLPAPLGKVVPLRSKG